MLIPALPGKAKIQCYSRLARESQTYGFHSTPDRSDDYDDDDDNDVNDDKGDEEDDDNDVNDDKGDEEDDDNDDKGDEEDDDEDNKSISSWQGKFSCFWVCSYWLLVFTYSNTTL